MCGRFSLDMAEHRRAERLFGRLGASLLVRPPRYNIAPTQFTPVIAQKPGKKAAVIDMLWGLVPFWAADRKAGIRAINARAETLREKPAFRNAFRRSRCLVPASGFYEWRHDGAKRRKTPFYFSSADPGTPLVFAGLWERWEREGEPLESFSIVTTVANGFVAPIHDRMPVILREDDWEAWIDPGNTDGGTLQALLKPAGEEVLHCWEVGTYVNNARNEGRKCAERILI